MSNQPTYKSDEEALKEFDSAFNWADQIKEQELARWRIMYGCEPQDIKSFILSLRKADREALRGLIAKERIEPHEHDYEAGYNKALEDVLKLIEE